MRAVLSISAHADLCADLLPIGEDDEILEDGAEAAWEWLNARATLRSDDELLLELPPRELLEAHRRGDMDEREDIEQRFMATWTPPVELMLALDELIRIGVGQLLVRRDC